MKLPEKFSIIIKPEGKDKFLAEIGINQLDKDDLCMIVSYLNKVMEHKYYLYEGNHIPEAPVGSLSFPEHEQGGELTITEEEEC